MTVDTKSHHPPRVKIESNGTLLKVTLPSRKRIFPMLINLFFMFVITCGEAFMINLFLGQLLMLLAPRFMPPQPGSIDGSPLFILFLLFFVVFLTFVWIIVVVQPFFWQYGGKEIAYITADSIRIRRQIWGIGMTQEYEAGSIRNLRVLKKIIEKATGISHAPRSFMARTIAMDYEQRSLEVLGHDLDYLNEEEANAILAAIGERFPKYVCNDQVVRPLIHGDK